MTIFKLNFKQFRRQYTFLLSYMVLFVGSIFFIARSIIYQSPLSLVMQVSQKLSIITFIYFCFMAYEYQSLPKRLNLQETINTIQSAKTRVFLNRLMLLNILVVVYTLVPISIIALYGTSVMTAQYFSYIMLSNILNILLVGVLASVIGSLLALNRGRISAYIIMLFSFFLISPFAENIAFTLYMLKNINIYPHWDLFRILAFDLDWMPDNFYGLAMEAPRWNLIFFWIFIFAAILWFKIGRSKKRSVQIISIVLVFISAVNLFGYFQPASVIRYDGRPDGASYGDHIYERDGGYLTDSYALPADFSVISYDMNFTIKRQLSADVTMQIEAIDGKDSYEFTLYRGYDILSVTDDANNALDFERNGNYFTINESFDEDATIHIIYEGSGNRYFSNCQGIALLGYAAYYPKPGHLQIWDDDENLLVANVGNEVSSYTVTVDSIKTVYSNLPGTDNTFSGETADVTLVAGLIEPMEIASIDLIAPTADIISEKELIEFETSWTNIVDLLDLDVSYSITNKPIIFTPSVTTRASGADNEVCVIMSDHVLMTEYYASHNIYTLIKSIIPYNEYKTVLKQCFIDFLSDPETFYSSNESVLPDYDLLKDHIEHNLDEVENEEDYVRFVESAFAMDSLVVYKMDMLGEDYVVKEIYYYLTDETTSIDEVDFLYNLQ